MTNKPLALYFHFPFCLKKCGYCAFYSFPCAEDSFKQAYCEALESQLAFLPRDRVITSVYFGGGTPPVAGVGRLCKLLRRIKSDFVLSDDCEITVEVNPGTVSGSDLRALCEAGANRVSIGVQSADDGVLKALSRIHDFETAKRCIESALRAGIENVSADVMFALPGQSVDGFSRGLEKIIALGVKHLSAYSLQLEEGTPFWNDRESLEFPAEETEEAQYSALCGITRGHGFEHYEISSFALPGFESRHNGTYWARGEYFGFGAGAHSFYRGKRFSSPKDAKVYIKHAPESLFAATDFASAPDISQAEAEEELVMLGLRTDRGAEIPEASLETARRIAALGYGTLNGRRLVLNDRGFRVSNEIIAEILA